MNLYDSILDVAAPYDGILLDAYGVFWGGNGVGLLPGALEVMEELVSQGKKVGVLSNATQLGAAEMEKVAKKGLMHKIHFHFYLTSGDVTKSLFEQGDLPFPTHKRKYFLFSEAHPKYTSPYALFEHSTFEETRQITEADFIYIPTPHLQGKDQTDPELFRKQTEALSSSKLPMLCANSDRFAHEGNPPRVVVRQGSIAALYEEAGGTVFYSGKPSRLSFSSAMHQFITLGVNDPAKIVMVGDTPETDIRGGKAFGMATALILETGIMKDREIKDIPSHEQPTYYLRRL